MTLGGHKQDRQDRSGDGRGPHGACSPDRVPGGARLSYDETKLYVADKGEAGGYGQQGITMSIFDTQYDIATNVVPIGKTTDHHHPLAGRQGDVVHLQCRARHLDRRHRERGGRRRSSRCRTTATPTARPSSSTRMTAPAASTAEVVSSFTGLRGSALAAQREYQTTPVLTIAVNRQGFVLNRRSRRRRGDLSLAAPERRRHQHRNRDRGRAGPRGDRRHARTGSARRGELDRAGRADRIQCLDQQNAERHAGAQGRCPRSRGRDHR